MSVVPFKQRFGFEEAKPIDSDFPESARIALAYLIIDLREQRAFSDWNADGVKNELLRTGRLAAADFFGRDALFEAQLLEALRAMQWWQVYTFCERVYRYHIDESSWIDDNDNLVVSKTKAEMLRYYADQLNDILAEDNIAYQFVDGQFQRRGRAQTQKSMQRVGTVLGQARLSTVRNHYSKARKFFDTRPEPDVANCIKEALCALEACLGPLSQKPVPKDFAKAIKHLEGNGARQIPPPIAEGMIKLHGYRGSGQGVAHAAVEGSRVTELEAELVLSLVASYITYLVDLLSEPEELPF